MTGDRKKDHIQDPRTLIKGHLQEAGRIWQDRASCDIGPKLGFNMMVIHVTPALAQEFGQSPQKAALMNSFIEASVPLDSTRGFRNALLGVASNTYNIGFPVTYFYDMLGIDLENDRLGPFEPAELPDTEREFLKVELMGVSRDMLGIRGRIVTQEQMAVVTPEQLAQEMMQFFIQHDGEFISPEALRQAYSQRVRGMYGLLQERLEGVERAVDWADEYHQKYQGIEFVSTADILRPASAYLEQRE